MRGRASWLGSTVAVILVAATASPSEAASCHHFSVWRYPTPQRCGQKQVYVWHKFVSPGRGPSGPDRTIPPERGMPLPSLAQADLSSGEADEATRARLLLRAAMEASYGH
jgi:hypothetical protein